MIRKNRYVSIFFKDTRFAWIIFESVKTLCDNHTKAGMRLEFMKSQQCEVRALATPHITDPCRFNLNEQKVAMAHLDPQSVLITKM